MIVSSGSRGRIAMPDLPARTRKGLSVGLVALKELLMMLMVMVPWASVGIRHKRQATPNEPEGHMWCFLVGDGLEILEAGLDGWPIRPKSIFAFRNWKEKWETTPWTRSRLNHSIFMRTQF
jgi:hypothetical protein